MKKFYFLLVLLMSTVSYAQPETNYDNKWYFGFNTGATWHTTDVENTFNRGFGFTLGKSYNYSYGRIASFDVRARFLRGWWYGQDLDTTGFSVPNQALSQGMTNYRDSLGYGLRNFQNENYKFNLELVLHGNSIRERTRLDPYIFGGIGISWNQAYGDYLQYDTTGGISTLEMYDYDLNNLNKKGIKNMQDGVWETALDGSQQNKFNVQFMPSLGFGLGYHIGSGHTIGFEHKTTFALHDEFDGLTMESEYPMDIYHYTSLYLRLRFDPRTDDNVDDPDQPVQNLDNDNQPPKVVFTTPARSGLEVNSSAYVVQANVKHVFDDENVSFTHNGIAKSGFYFNPKSDQFSINVDLVSGQNVFEITGVNQYGTDLASTIVIFKRETPTPPIVDFIQPGGQTTTVRTASYNAQTRVLNVQGQDQIEVLVNGINQSAFSFDAANNLVRFNASLKPGNNVLLVKATNKDGSAQDQVNIILERANNDPAPIVYFTDPNASPYSTKDGNFDLEAKIFHVSGSQNVIFKQNGNVLNSFNFNPSNNDFSAYVALVPGQNIFQLYGSNNQGTADATTVIVFEQAAQRPPIVTIAQPSQNNESTNDPTYTFIGRVLNVNNKNQVQLKLNGQNLTSFSFNTSNGQVVANLNLAQGNNTVFLKGTNADGTDQKITNVVYRPSQTVQPPRVHIIDPSNNPYTHNANSYTVKASIEHVTNRSDVNVSVNGNTVNGWTFQNGLVQLNLQLIEGANVVTVSAFNTAGSDSKNTTLYYRKPNVVEPPVITFIDPSVDPKTSTNASYLVRATITNVTQKSQIELRINGVLTTAYGFSVSSNTLSVSTALAEGSNSIAILATNAGGTDAESTTIVYRKPAPQNPPVVNIFAPSSSPFTSSSSPFTVKANIYNVSNASGVNVKVNGVPTNAFSFDGQQGLITVNLNLADGNNTVKITGTNSAGSASDQATIVYNKRTVLPPTITFTDPSEPGTVVNSNQHIVYAKVYRVDDAGQIQVKKDGQVLASAGYQFDANTKVLKIPSSLNFGNNVFEVKATNEGGTASGITTLKYEKQADPCDAPSIALISPTASMETSNATMDVQFDVANLATGGHVQLKVNGVTKRFVKTGNRYSASISLANGNNSLQIIATDDCGQDSKLLNVKYTPVNEPCMKPNLTLIRPSRENSTTLDASTVVQFAISNMTNSNVVFKVNGSNIRSTFDPTRGIATATVNLSVGLNSIEVTATNDCGSTDASVKITRIRCENPNFSLASSNVINNGKTFDTHLDLEINTEEINNRNQISVTSNGRNIGFTFNTVTQSVLVDVPLSVGLNTVKISGSNDCGAVEYVHKVTREVEPPKQDPPTIVFTKPSKNTTVNNATYQVQLKTTNVVGSKNVILKVNGSPVRCIFNQSTQTAIATVTLREGSNILQASAFNSVGTASDAKSLKYVKLDAGARPGVKVTNPSTSTITVQPGFQTVTGSVTGITSESQLVIKVNGVEVTNARKNFGADKMTFAFSVHITSTTQTYLVEIMATNAKGTTRKVVTMNLGGQSRQQRSVPKPGGERPTIRRN